MSLSDLSIRRPVFAWMLMYGLILFGAISLGRLGVSLMPDVDFPVLEVRMTWEGAAPEILEAEMVDPIEQKLIAVEGVKELRSSVRPGQATVEIEFALERDIDAAVQEVQAALSQIRLPFGVDPPVIRKNSTEGDPILWLGVSGPQSLRELITYVDTVIADEFQVIPGVGEVALGGFAERNLRLWVDAAKLQEKQLTILDLRQAIARQHLELSAGYLENDRRETAVRALGEGSSPEEVGDIVITHRGGQPIHGAVIRVRDVCRVEDGLADIRRLSRANGEPAVSLAIRKQRGANEVAIGRAVRAKVEELNARLPDGMRVQVNVDVTRFVEQAVLQTGEELLLAAGLTALICFVFLGNWTSAINVLLAIPTSILGTFLVMYFLGFTLNTFTLLALALAIGIVVDDAIMVLENIVRHHQQLGKARVKASREGAREITFAAVAATVAVIAIFLPVAFMEGVIGRFFFQFGVTLTAAVALSLLEALTLTPMRCSRFMAGHDRQTRLQRAMDGLFGGVARAYRFVLGLALHVRLLVLAGAGFLFYLSLQHAAELRREFVPTQDQNYIRMSVQTPPGSSLAFTDAQVRRLEDTLRARPEVVNVFSSVGGFTGVPNQASISITLTDKAKRTLSQAELVALFRKELSAPGVRLGFSDLSARGLTPRRSQPVEFNLRGPDYAGLDRVAQTLMTRLTETGLVLDLDSSYKTGMPELRIRPNREAAALRGVSVDAISETIQAAFGGVREGKFTRDGRRYDVRLRLNPEERENAADLARLQVRTTFGELVPLADVVTSEEVKTVQTITRVNRQRAVSVTGNLAAGASQADALAAVERLALEALPPGYSFQLEGGSRTFQEAFDSLWLAFLLGVVVAYMVLASQFNSFLHPLTVLLALPFSISGAVWVLRATDQSLNLYSAIGIILLMGIVKKNSILLVEFTNQLRHEDGLSVREALLRAAPIRLRPILMTSLATMGAAVPLALGLGPGAEARRPLALAVLGGVGVSTLFTLFVVPAAYSLLAVFEGKNTLDEDAETMPLPHPGPESQAAKPPAP
jgi:HAE1 family hydrophobic/amphiphilic exporter-1